MAHVSPGGEVSAGILIMGRWLQHLPDIYSMTNATSIKIQLHQSFYYQRPRFSRILASAGTAC